MSNSLGIATKDAAKRLDLTPTRIRQLMSEGKLEFTATPLERLISVESVEALRRIREEEAMRMKR